MNKKYLKKLNKAMSDKAADMGITSWEWLPSDNYGKVNVDGILIFRVPLTSPTPVKFIAENILKTARRAKAQAEATARYSA